MKCGQSLEPFDLIIVLAACVRSRIRAGSGTSGEGGITLRGLNARSRLRACLGARLRRARELGHPLEDRLQVASPFTLFTGFPSRGSLTPTLHLPIYECEGCHAAGRPSGSVWRASNNARVSRGGPVIVGIATFVVGLGIAVALFVALDVKLLFLVGPAIGIGAVAYAA